MIRWPKTPRYLRHGEGLEFDRVSFFTDAVYAIAMTLLVVELRIPVVAPDRLAETLRGEGYAVAGFFFGFVLLGRHWVVHHSYWARLASIDRRLAALNLVYLALVAFIPFPVGLISRYPHEMTAFALFALSMAGLSLLELRLYNVALRRGHMAQPPSPVQRRRDRLALAAPAVVMLASIPLATVLGTLGALALWIVNFPLALWLAQPARAA